MPLAVPNTRIPLELVLVQQLFELICGANGKGQTILLVEQNARMALRAAKRGYVLEIGRIVLADQASTLLDDEAVKWMYFGGD